MNRSLDSALDSALAAINLSDSSISEDLLLSSGKPLVVSSNQVELSSKPRMSAEVACYNNLLVDDDARLEVQSSGFLDTHEMDVLKPTIAGGGFSGRGGHRVVSSPQIEGGGRDIGGNRGLVNSVFFYDVSGSESVADN